MNYTLFCTVYNLFDTKNEDLVYDATGRATYDIVDEQTKVPVRDYIREWPVRPDYYSEPRLVKFGVKVSF